MLGGTFEKNRVVLLFQNQRKSALAQDLRLFFAHNGGVFCRFRSHLCGKANDVICNC
jgi:hypothetical protein